VAQILLTTRHAEDERRATEDEIVLCFLQAERTSLRWGEHVSNEIDSRWYLLEEPNLRDNAQNPSSPSRRRAHAPAPHGEPKL
jgi:hypothetical protein